MNRIHFGEYVRQLRRDRQISQKMVADKLGVDISLLCKIENGERNIQRHMLAGIAELFNVDYRKLQIQYIEQRILLEFGSEPYWKEAITQLANQNK
jgi:transcriptional regulator with XRE-family HTH domain